MSPPAHVAEPAVRLSVVPGGRTEAGSVTVVGVPGGSLTGIDDQARSALAGATTVAGARRHLDLWRQWVTSAAGREWRARTVPTVDMEGDPDAFAQQVAQRAVEEGQHVCVLASGDPGFFGVVRALRRVVDRAALRVLPAASSVSVAFARLGLPWDDAVVVAAAGGDPAGTVRAVRVARKAAVLTSPAAPPQVVGRAVVDAGLSMDLVAVCSRLGYPDEQVAEVTLDELARGTWDPLSVLVLVGPGGLQTVGWDDGGGAGSPVPTWGLDGDAFRGLESPVPDAEVRAVALAKLVLPPTGVLWDLGPGSGPVAIDAVRLAPGLTPFALRADGAGPADVAADAADRGAPVHVVTGELPGALDTLPDPDRVFAGDVGAASLDVALRRLRPGGRIVVATGDPARAAHARARLGSLVQISLARSVAGPEGEPDPEGAASGGRLKAEDPVFIAWGPDQAGGGTRDEEPPARPNR